MVVCMTLSEIKQTCAINKKTPTLFIYFMQVNFVILHFVLNITQQVFGQLLFPKFESLSA